VGWLGAELLARSIQFVLSGTPAQLRRIPRDLAYVEVGIDALAVVSGLVRQQGAHSRWRRLNDLAVMAMFVVHSVRVADYVSPGNGRLDVPTPFRHADCKPRVG
jgi:hypothetical protein